MKELTSHLSLGSGHKDKERKTIYVSKGVYKRFEKLVKQNEGRSVSLAIENLMALAVWGRTKE